MKNANLFVRYVENTYFLGTKTSTLGKVFRAKLRDIFKTCGEI
jgi:hypothetical protein